MVPARAGVVPSRRPTPRRRSRGPRACGGEYPPRFQLSEVRLAEEFGVNRDTVRNATRSLREKGWITTTPALGSFVADERPRG
ncbi:GntR family transcriptional regulator [Streptomyces acidiscabies]|uniref:GntR family transcriptional regulator n=1 Tax=Streptomyces acidiscabies TaxID=42234 RepID=UPI0030D2A827